MTASASSLLLKPRACTSIFPTSIWGSMLMMLKTPTAFHLVAPFGGRRVAHDSGPVRRWRAAGREGCCPACRAIGVHRSALSVKTGDVDASDGVSDKRRSLMIAAAAAASAFKGRTGRQHQTGLGRSFLAWLFAAPPRPRSPVSRLLAGVFRERRSQGESWRKNTDAASARSFMQLRFPWPSTLTPPPLLGPPTATPHWSDGQMCEWLTLMWWSR